METELSTAVWQNTINPYISKMAKYKLEYIWLDGYEPVPNLRGKTKYRICEFPETRRIPDVGFRWQLDAPGRRQKLGLHAEARSGFPDPPRKTARW